MTTDPAASYRRGTNIQIEEKVCVLTPGLVVGGQITPYGQQNYVAGAAENVGATDSGSYRQHRAIVPDGYHGSPLLVNFSIKVNGITEADGRQTAVVLDTYFRMMWKDWRLRYPEADKNDEEDDLVQDKEEKVRKTIVDPIILEKIWLPDPSILSVRKVYLVSVLKKVQGVILFSDGTVFVSTVLKIELECSTMFSKFPFDVQECPLDIHSYMYEVTELEMRWVPQGLSVDPRVSNQLSNYDHRFTMYPDNITCLCYKCIPPESPCVRAMLVLSRKALGHILATFLPSGLFVAVSWASLFWPSDVIPGRTVLVITALLTLVSMHSAVRQSGPETSYVKAVDVWMFMCVLLSTCVLFEYGIVLL
ncbi:glutamate-gated chloride channel alpha-like [Homarus americanus]|uniref:glutamate-gated chloride channel alpha-like n=1 Tax=Homarus americanus TaxID=6706 RepID=UPI001C453D7F|nr:glutamate-gated chloride channel alpha-like [Homarus americanus]